MAFLPPLPEQSLVEVLCVSTGEGSGDEAQVTGHPQAPVCGITQWPPLGKRRGHKWVLLDMIACGQRRERAPDGDGLREHAAP